MKKENNYYIENDVLFIKTFAQEYTNDSSFFYSDKCLNILESEGFYSYFLYCIKHGIDIFFIKSYDGCLEYRFSKEDLIEFINKNSSNSNIKRMLEEIEKKELLDSFNKKIHSATIDGKEYIIGCKSLLKILLYPQKEFIGFFKEDSNYKIGKRQLAYFLVDFIEKNNLNNKFKHLNINEKLNILKSYEIVDYESINYFQGIDNYKEYSINKELKEYIFSNLDPSYTKVEKSICVYIMLCRFFSYDPSEYVSEPGDRSLNKINHLDKARLEKLSINENSIVCYEFNVIFAKFLEELNINYQINSCSSIYGGGHVSLSYIVDKYIIDADAVTSILGGDLVNAKVNNKLRGLVCKNTSQKTKDDFEGILANVYKGIIKKRSFFNKEYKIKNIIDIYNRVNKNKLIKVSFKEKIEILIDEINQSKLDGVEAVGYLLKLSNVLFDEKERARFVNFCVVKFKKDGKYQLGVVITVNDKNYIEQVDKNRYFCYIPFEELQSFKKKEFSTKMNNGSIKYIRTTKHEIPGFYKNTLREKEK